MELRTILKQDKSYVGFFCWRGLGFTEESALAWSFIDDPTPEVLGCLGVTEADLGFTSLTAVDFFASGVLEDVEMDGVSEPSGFGRCEEEIIWEDSLDVFRLRDCGVARPEGLIWNVFLT